jgi:DNA mismatch repair protein MutL
MRSTSTEFSHISQTVLRLALPFEGVAFRLQHNGRTTLELPPAERLARLLEAWPAEFREHYLLIDEVFGDAGIVGIAGLPELARPTPAHQYLYLNGRSIRDKFISHALREAYRGLTEPGRHPAAVLLLTLPPDEVDVNVHPTKSEVRFRDGTRIHGLIQTAVRRKLSGSELAPSAVAVRSFDESREDQKQSLQSKLADFFKQPPPLQPPLPPLTPKSPFPTFSPSTPSPGTPGEGWGEGYAKTAPTPPTPAPTTAPSAPRPSAPRIPAIQLHNSYLVAESDDGLIIIDQHALHERIIYEELLDRVSRGPLESQRLLIPQTLPASARQLALLEQITPLLRRLGIEAEPFGPDSVAVNAFPSFLSRLEPGQFVADLLDRGEQETLDLHDEELLHDVLDMMSCKAAVKAGEALSVSEIEALLARRSLVERASNCPHGRPTTLRMSLKDLEKQFKRTGF